MIDAAPYVMFLMRADPLRGQVGVGGAMEIETFLGPEMTMNEASAIWAKKVEISTFSRGISREPNLVDT